ncbi:sensor histidine kinase [Streptosporangium sp. NPDC000396]|uniref:sensor histidine kinase n=1 Tax=Streptosporangium sp. NPDC000396 TaxID=3366185 RepID=UPI003682E999
MSLRSRLFVGLLGVSVILLVALSAVSVLVLRGHLRDRLEGQLVTAAAKPGIGKTAPSGQLGRVLTGSTYAAALFNLTSGRARLVEGDAAEATAVPFLIERLGGNRIKAYAQAGQTFDLDPSGEYSMLARAVTRARPNMLVVVAVPLESVNAPVRRLILAELLAGGALILALAMIGRMLIIGGLAPLSRMADTAHHMARSGDLSLRMPEGSSEAGRLGGTINLLLDRVAGALRDRWASEDRVRHFAADASHELRTPLAAIRGYAELYRTGAIPSEELSKIMGRIEDEATRMGDLVGQLLELARLDRGAELQPAETDLAAAAREIAADCAAIAPESPVLVDAPNSLPAVVDEPGIRQILINLLANVRAHTPEGTTAVVRLARQAHGGVLIEVVDDGPGMPQEQAARAFDRFSKGGPAGAGLGLAIVKAIADAHGGRCWITSAAEHGTAVHVELPGQVAGELR